MFFHCLLAMIIAGASHWFNWSVHSVWCRLKLCLCILTFYDFTTPCLGIYLFQSILFSAWSIILTWKVFCNDFTRRCCSVLLHFALTKLRHECEGLAMYSQSFSADLPSPASYMANPTRSRLISMPGCCCPLLEAQNDNLIHSLVFPFQSYSEVVCLF